MLTSQSDLLERWRPYWLWECYHNGMWDSERKDVNRIQDCAKLLSNPVRCMAAMIRALNEFPISAEQHLSKPSGRRPWIGQAACCAELGATEEETRVAWNFYMTPAAQDKANEIADEVIAQWEKAIA